MSNPNDKPPTKPADPAPVKPDFGKTIAVKHLAFHLAHPKLDAATSISAESRAGQRKVTIDFVPSLRHHRLEIHKPDAPVRVMFIYEGHVASWEPV